MAKNGDTRQRVNRMVERMRTAPARVAVPVGVGLVLGGTILAPLPVFGIWMVPLGLAVLAPHWPGAERLSRRFYWWSLMFLRWSIRHNFVRVKRAPRYRNQAPPPES